MDLYDLVTHIPHILMVLVGFTVVVHIYFGGILNLSTEIDNSQRNEFRKAIVLENLMNVEANRTELGKVASSAYSYDHRRAYIPVEFFTNENDNGVGYSKNGKHCYIERVSGLDGENFSFYIQPTTSSPGNSLDCTTQPSHRATVNAVSSPALLVRKASNEPLLPARLYVYEIQ